MTTSLVSPKYQIVIPKDIRNRYHIRAGQRIQFIDTGEQIIMVPLMEPSELRGSLKSKTPFTRERDRDILTDHDHS